MKVQVNQMVIAIGAQMIRPARKLFLSRIATGTRGAFSVIFFDELRFSLQTGRVTGLPPVSAGTKLPEFAFSHNRFQPLGTYSTVTDFARLRGWSTSVPMK